MKTYQSHKIVKAAKITDVFRGPATPSDPIGTTRRIIEIEGGEQLVVEGGPFERAEVGGYLVEYSDGYRSYSPAKAFEEGYTEITAEQQCGPKLGGALNASNVIGYGDVQAAARVYLHGGIRPAREGSDRAIEQEIQAKGLTAPRVTPADIEANIASEHYFTAQQGVHGESIENDRAGYASLPSLGLLTFCVLVLKNGFTVTGESACASPENFDAEIGREIARENAVKKLWPLMGYAFKERLAALDELQQ